jgi:DNA polymerase III subunit delta'
MKTEIAKLSWPIVGNGHIFEFLSKTLTKENISGSYIFAGPADLGKATAANFFAQSLVCELGKRDGRPCGQCTACVQADRGIHGDIYLIKKDDDKKNISIEQVRDFIKNLGMSSFLNSYKIGIIKEAEKLSQGAVNGLLKTLEEPKDKVVIIMTTSELETLPKTILSRSQILRFKAVSSDTIYDDLIENYKASRSQAKNFSRLAAGRPALALKFLEDNEYYESYKNSVSAFMSLLSLDINKSFSAIENILGKEAHGQEAVKIATAVLDIWQNLARDLMLIDLNLAELVQHQAFEPELAAAKGRLNLRSLLGLLNVLKQAKEYLAANVSPKLALENVAVNI